MATKSVWGKGELVFAAPKALQAQFTATANDLAVVFPDWSLDLQGDSAPMALTQVAAIRVPIKLTTKQTLVGYVQTLQLGIERTAGVRAAIAIDCAGQSFTQEYGFKTPVGAPPGESLPMEHWRTFSHAGLELGPGTGLSGPVADYQASIMVTVQRRTAADRILITIEGLDVAPVWFK